MGLAQCDSRKTGVSQVVYKERIVLKEECGDVDLVEEQSQGGGETENRLALRK